MIEAPESTTAKLCSFARAYHSTYARKKIFDDSPAFDFMGLEQYEETGQLIGHNYQENLIDPNLSFHSSDIVDKLNRYLMPIPISRAAFAGQALIGNTPTVKLSHIGLPDGVNLFAKLELFNPAGSVKDRVGKAMIEDAEQTGRLKPGGTIIEATAGNTGLGIAFAALNRGYRVIFVVPTKFSEEKQALLRALGAEVINTPREEGMLGASAKADALRAEIPGAISLGQFVNPANPRVHYETTGPEIYWDLNRKIDFLIAGAGSGGTYSGVVKKSGDTGHSG